MSKNKTIKSVSFNANNPDDVRILDAFKRRNFSGHVKKLLLDDLAKRQQAPINSVTIGRQSKSI